MAKLLRGTSGDIRRVMRYATDHDWTVQRTRGGHLKFSKPGRSPVFTSYTPSDGKRAALNAMAQLRRAERLRDAQGGHRS